MALNVEDGKKMLQLLTSRYDDWRWRSKIEKTLSLPPTGVGDDAQRGVFLYLKNGLKAYKSRRADPDSWMLGGYVTKEVIERAKFDPTTVGEDIKTTDLDFLGQDPGPEVDEAWWEDMLVNWFDEPEPEVEEQAEAEGSVSEGENSTAEAEKKDAGAE